ncbi:hypothetical protein PAMP_019447 [Pampus punctatissimus]
MVGNGEGGMKPGQMGINKETGLKNGSCYGQRRRMELKECHRCHIRNGMSRPTSLHGPLPLLLRAD